MYASFSGYGKADAYIKTIYGQGASEKGLREYYELTELSRAYQANYQDSLTYTDADLRAAEEENPAKFSTFSYNYYYLNAYNFIESAEEGTTEYTDEQKAEGIRNAEAAAKTLTDGITTVAAFDAAIAALPVNAENTGAASFSMNDVSYESIPASFAEWISTGVHKPGDMTYTANTTTDADGNKTVTGYYVVMFGSANDNNFALANVRHILVAFEGGSYDSTTGQTVYTDEEKAAAMTEAEAILNEWKNGEATEDTFAALANAKSDDGDGTTGGLYEDIFPGQMVSAFEDWCFDNRKVGDTGIVETEYGCHVMYYSGDSETTYRDYLITTELTKAAYNEWYETVTAAVTATEGDCKYISMDLVLSRAQ